MKNFKRFSAVALVLCIIVGVFAACAFTPEAKLKGAWRDSTGTVGYEFKDNNICSITYADVTIPLVNIRYNGTVDGAYTTEKRDDGNYYVTITYTILAKSVSETYMFTVDGGVLTLVSPEDGSSKTLMAYEEVVTTTAAPTVETTAA